jgi:Fur family ferric uptake transcriptional regulator
MVQLDYNFANLIHQRGFRVTNQRQIILDAIRESNGHSSPDEICQRVFAKNPAINTATVYRNLSFLCEMKLIVSAQIGGHLFYELAGTEPHHHLICRRCNRVEQVGNIVVKDLFEKLEREYSFLIDMDHLTLFGLCSDCRETEKRYLKLKPFLQKRKGISQ